MRVEFRFIEGRCKPLHFEGGCAGSYGTSDDERLKQSTESNCIKTSCRYCNEMVFFIQHNGGSVWIDPPLGPPWHRHQCLENQDPLLGAHSVSPFVGIGSDLLSVLGGDGQSVTGVVVKSEISKDRRQTILSLAVAESDELVLLVKGGADSFLGRIVVVAGEKYMIRCIDEPEYAFAVTATLSAPEALVQASIALPQHLSAVTAAKIRSDMAPTPYDGLSEKDAKLLREFRTNGRIVKWSLTDLIALVPLLRNKEQDQVVHHAAIKILGQAEKHGDCSGAGRLAAQLSGARRKRLVAWFHEFSPISINLQQKKWKAHIPKNASGESEPFQASSAQLKPFYSDR